MSKYVATSEVPCGRCGNDTIPPTPGDDTEFGHYCEGCGWTTLSATEVAAERWFG